MNRPTLQQRLENLPPFLAAYMARKRAPKMTVEQRRSRWRSLQESKKPKRLYGWIRLTHAEIAEQSGLSERIVRTISGQISWDHVKTSDMVKFLNGCGIEITRMQRTNQFLSECMLKRKHYMAGVSERRFKRLAYLAAKKAEINPQPWT